MKRNHGDDIQYDLSIWEEDSQSVTFILTEDCQLRCKYCYICGKNSFNVMTWETAKQAVDFILSYPPYQKKPGVVLDFIGGEPFLEIALMDQICDYFKVRAYETDHPWFNNYRISMATNGLLYDAPAVQEFIKKNQSHLSIGISIDGTPEKHDMMRVFQNGRGSYAAIAKKIPLWLQQFPGTTKATVAHNDLHLLKDSVLHLWSLGINEVAMNCIFEDVWEPGDDEILERQLVELADEILAKDLYKGHKCTFFSRRLGFPMDPEKDRQNWCGSGKMVAIGTDGKMYPCVRFAQYSLGQKKEIVVGRVDSGIDENKRRPFLTLDRVVQSPQKCIECDVALGCSWCQGYNYDAADTETVFQRSTSLCAMHKARVRANNYFWNKYDRVVTPEPDDPRVVNMANRRPFRSLIVLMDSQAPSFCHYEPCKDRVEKLDDETLKKIVYFALTENLSLNLVMGAEPLTDTQKEILRDVDYVQLRSAKTLVKNATNGEPTLAIVDFETESELAVPEGTFVVTLRIAPESFDKLPEWLEKNVDNLVRVSISLKGVARYRDEELDKWKKTLAKTSQWLRTRAPRDFELSVLTDRLGETEPNHCDAGLKHATVAPDGKVYLCPGFYCQEKPEPIETLDYVMKNHEIPIKNKYLLELKNAPICRVCDAYHCRRCVWLNRQTTLELNTPSKQQCVLAHLERNESRNLIDSFGIAEGVEIPEIDYLDPFDLAIKKASL